MAIGKNVFNRLSSKDWVFFQKSWFQYEGPSHLLRAYMAFFTFREAPGPPVFYMGPHTNEARAAASECGFELTTHLPEGEVQFAFIDLCEAAQGLKAEAWPSLRKEVEALVQQLAEKLVHRRFLTVAIPNVFVDGTFYPWAWDLACRLGQVLTLKDEKIACLEGDQPCDRGYFEPHKNHFYLLHFRRDEYSGVHITPTRHFYDLNEHSPLPYEAGALPPSWFILRPQRRNKKEVLHPAKFPESLPELYIRALTRKGDNVFDPMSGTGSTQLAALRLGRNGYGTELSGYFNDIGRERCLAYLFEQAGAHGDHPPSFDLITGDARKVLEYGFPMQYLIFTSPPYWDMLNMKGAENKAKRQLQGLKTNYSDDSLDLGNIPDYQTFVNELVKVYHTVSQLLRPGGHFVIVVKNIKKGGRNYPFAWDLAALLQEHLILLPETLWCQDDQSLAPYGYPSTFVSNTFHQYCLCFRKPG
jgi:DNA modification methylase